eukprot:XP_001701959.1 predicted protein [Chlamydomonas reinhardtii]
MHASCASMFACLLLIAACMHATNAELVMVYSLQRHGARNVLPKGALLTETDLIGGPTLLPEGQRQTYNAGAAFRARYLSNTTCSATGTCLNGSDASGGVSSGGKYGVVGQPGVGFGECPAYQDALEGWFGSAEFQSQANASAGLRAQVAARWPGTDTSLENWWNVYDAINVYRSYGLGAPTPNFTDIFTPIQDLAYWLEVRKMQPALTHNLLAGPLLADLLGSMSDAVEAAGNGSQLHYAPATAGSGGSSNSSDSRMYVSMPEAADWCSACGNNDVAACRIVSLQSEEGEGGDGDGEAWKIAVSVVVTFVGALALAMSPCKVGPIAPTHPFKSVP